MRSLIAVLYCIQKEEGDPSAFPLYVKNCIYSTNHPSSVICARYRDFRLLGEDKNILGDFIDSFIIT